MKRCERIWTFSLCVLLAASSTSSLAQSDRKALFRAIDIFPLVNQHVHGSTIVELPNPGSGADIVTMRNSHWALAYNDTEDGRHSLAVSISTDEGKSWQRTRRLELDLRDRRIATSSGYPSIVQGRDGTLHIVYSYHHKDRKGGPSKTIKYVQFNEAWITQGDTSESK